MSSKLSGAQNRKRKARAQKEDQSSAKTLATFFTKTPAKLTNDTLDEPPLQNFDASDSASTVVVEPSVEIVDTGVIVGNDLNQTASIIVPESKSYSDIGSWPLLTASIRATIIKKGPEPVIGPDSRFPQNTSDRNRHFSVFHCTRILPNKETIPRSWLQYSNSSDRVFCFCCKLFDPSSKSKLGSEGLNDWKHIGNSLKSHETSNEHFISYRKWLDAEKCLRTRSGIDAALQSHINKESAHWKAVLERLIAIVMYLSKNNLAFRGTSDRLDSPNNGNFLGLVELFGRFDPVMSEHLRRVRSKEIHDHYCGKIIQNELIMQLGEKVKSAILEKVRAAKYFSIILDCTPDVSHIEQMSFTIRFVDITGENIRVKEHFLSYRPASDSTGEGLTSLLLDELTAKCDLDMNNCRGQGYDNGANMIGKNKGVQKRVLDLYPRAFFNPCGCHSLNLVVGDAAKSSVKSVSLFGVLQRLYTIFSGSVKRWSILKISAETFTVKAVSETRWECRVQSLKAVRYQYPEIYDALLTLAEEANDPKISSEAKSLAMHLADFQFIVTLIVWYDILFQVNLASKTMQAKDMNLAAAVNVLQGCEEYLRDYRVTGYESAVISAKEIAESLGVDPIFKEAPSRRKRRMFDYEGQDDAPTDPQQLFKTTVFYSLVDTAIVSIEERFAQLKQHNSAWGFLYDIKNLPEDEVLVQCCLALQKLLQREDDEDINGIQLYDELRHIQHCIRDSSVTPIDVLQYIQNNKMHECFCNIWISLRILLTIPVTVASGERSFSKLKLIKTYLRSTMTQDRLTALATLAIENEVADSLNMADLIANFANSKARRVNFH